MAKTKRSMQPDVFRALNALRRMVRGLRSDRYTPEILERMTRDYPKIAWETTNSQHDVPGQAPDELVAAVRKFAATA